jgi:hypothetical protein
MYSKVILACLVATAVSASPLNGRQASWESWSMAASSAAASSTGIYWDSSSSSAWQASSTYSSTSTAVTPNPSVSQDFINMVELAATEVDKYKVLQMDPTKLVFDFNKAAQNPPAPSGQGGQVDLAKPNNFPSIIGTGVTAAVGFMNPCGLNTPHIHPRATEFLVLAQGSNVQTGFILENGFTTQQNTTLSQFQGTVFPEGAIHFNDNCEPAVFISALSNEDPGASLIAQNFFSLDPEIVEATLGFPSQIDATNFGYLKAGIPDSFALGTEDCLKRCGISY